MKKGIIYLLLSSLAAAFFTSAKAQVELTSGIDMSYPLLFNSNNSKLNYSQIGFGITLGLSYKPTGTQFFPTLDYSLGRTKLPLVDFESNVAYMNINYQNLILKGNYVVTFNNNNSLYIIGGIGFSVLKRAGFGVSGKNGGAMRVTLDSVKYEANTYPAMSLGLEYVYGNAVNQNIYISMGLSAQYIYLLPGRNDYYISVLDAQHNFLDFSPSFTGRPIIPNFYLRLHYLLGKNIVFWKKKDSRYL